MGNRIEILREYIDNELLNMTDSYERSLAYVHLYGVSQACALIALKRGENVELATMAGMLHDLYRFKYRDSRKHGKKGAVLARERLNELQLTDENETDQICSAIRNHSSKKGVHSAFDEVLIDADVMEHGLYNMTSPFIESEKKRFNKLMEEFQIDYKV